MAGHPHYRTPIESGATQCTATGNLLAMTVGQSDYPLRLKSRACGRTVAAYLIRTSSRFGELPYVTEHIRAALAALVEHSELRRSYPRRTAPRSAAQEVGSPRISSLLGSSRRCGGTGRRNTVSPPTILPDLEAPARSPVTARAMFVSAPNCLRVRIGEDTGEVPPTICMALRGKFRTL